MLRRGLAVTGAEAALVTNIAADHLGELGIHDLPALAAAKLVIARAVGPEGRIVLNADDPERGRVREPAPSHPLAQPRRGNPLVRGPWRPAARPASSRRASLVLVRSGERTEVARSTRFR